MTSPVAKETIKKKSYCFLNPKKMVRCHTVNKNVLGEDDFNKVYLMKL